MSDSGYWICSSCWSKYLFESSAERCCGADAEHVSDGRLYTDGGNVDRGQNPLVEEIGYTEAVNLLEAEAEMLMAVARKQLGDGYVRKGDGWQHEDARYHFWKGIDEFFSANHAVKQGDLVTMQKRIGDGWNHILMASFVAYSEGDSDETAGIENTGREQEAGR